jgi:hypothetical protein
MRLRIALLDITTVFLLERFLFEVRRRKEEAELQSEAVSG